MQSSPSAKRAMLLLALASLLLGIVSMGATPLFDVDEGAFSEASREMLQSGDFGFTFLNGEPRFDKPILVYWLQVLSMLLWGQNELGARMVSLIAGITSAFIAARFAQRWSGRDESALIVLVLYLSCFGPLVMRHAATADALLNLWLCACSCCLIESLRLNTTTEQQGEANVAVLAQARLHMRLAWVFCALALLTKGLIGLLAPAWVVLGSCIAGRNFKAVRWSFSDPLALLAWAGIGLPWYVYAYWRFPNDFIQGLFGQHHLSRSLQAMEGHSGSPAYTLAMLIVLALPFTPLLVTSLWQLRKQQALSQPVIGLLAHSLGMLMLFSLVATKLPHYAMYALLPLLVLMGIRLETSRKLWLGCCALGLLMLLATASLHAMLAYAIAHPSTEIFYAALIEHGLQHSVWSLTERSVLVLAAIAIIFAAFTRLEKKSWLLLGLGMQASLCLVLLPAIGQILQGPIKTLALSAAHRPTVSFELRAPSFSFYRQQITQAATPQIGEQVIVRARDYPRLHELSAADAQWVLVDASGPLLLLLRR
ncbi:MAG: phospholipid carrier-dependent glycosyltransferase [Proteobacteria bacterium]|nr:phospholipid carrier-dependent glycosyltransferase [Pseudomonadota bacterium]